MQVPVFPVVSFEFLQSGYLNSIECEKMPTLRTFDNARSIHASPNRTLDVSFEPFAKSLATEQVLCGHDRDNKLSDLGLKTRQAS